VFIKKSVGGSGLLTVEGVEYRDVAVDVDMSVSL
jgi:hypothetical protein